MMNRTNDRPKLSRAILDMKFMKKSKIRVEQEEEAAEGQAMYSNEITEEMRKGGKYKIVEVGMNICSDLIEGRLSFGGLNTKVERLMTAEYAKRQEVVEKLKEKDVSDFDMAKRYNPLVNTIHKNTSNKKRNKRKFVKPAEME